MPSQSWMPRSEYRLERGLRQVRVCTGQGWVSGIATKPNLPLLTGNFMEWLEEAPLPQKPWPSVSQTTEHFSLPAPLRHMHLDGT